MTTPDPLPYHQIPDYPETYSPGNIAARMVDGLGYRYYWATKDLRQEDLDFKPSTDGKTTDETMDHLLGLSTTILNTVSQRPNIRPAKSLDLDYSGKRKATLENLKAASDLLKAAQDEEIENFQIIYQRGDQKSAFPFWNLLNGPLADAIYHVGQIVSFRRTSGNPIHPFVNVFRGKTKE
ncbi:MAG: hypothetical protein AAGD05_13505 [Bacteroidota bacterium]